MMDSRGLTRIGCGLAVLQLLASPLGAQAPLAANGHTVRVNGKAVYYEESGGGEPLVLLHNFGGTAAAWKDYVDAFAKKYRVLAVDLPGHGRSAPVDTGLYYYHANAARQVLGLLDSLRIRRVRVIGESSGGMVTLYMATQAPDRVEAAATIGAQIYITPALRKQIRDAGPDSLDAEVMARYTADHGRAGAFRIARQFWHEADVYGDPMFTPDLLGTIRSRWLVIQGFDDPIVAVDQGIEMARHIPGARLWIVPQGGHLPHRRPANVPEFTRILLDFLGGGWKPIP